MDGLDDFDAELGHAIDMKLGKLSVKVLALDRIIISRKAANQEKDRLILPVLEDTAAVLGGEKSRKRK
jgi:hypothetical protein